MPHSPRARPSVTDNLITIHWAWGNSLQLQFSCLGRFFCLLVCFCLFVCSFQLLHWLVGFLFCLAWFDLVICLVCLISFQSFNVSLIGDISYQTLQILLLLPTTLSLLILVFDEHRSRLAFTCPLLFLLFHHYLRDYFFIY